MASPQTDDGFTKVAFELNEAFSRYFPGKGEGQIIWAILRRTYGWDKTTDYISYDQLSGDTGLSRRTVIYCVQNLIAKNMIIVVPQNHGSQLNLMGIQKDYEKWLPNNNSVAYQTLLNKKQLKYTEMKIVAPVQTITSEIVAPVQTIGCTSANNCVTPVQTNAKTAKLFAPTTDIQNNQQIITTDIINKPEKKVEKSEIEIPDWIDKETWKDFLEVRKKKRAPMTVRAIELMIKKLLEFKNDGIDPNKLLEQSILKGWTDVYPLDSWGYGQKKNSSGQKERKNELPQLRSAFRDLKGIPSNEGEVCQPN